MVRPPDKLNSQTVALVRAESLIRVSVMSGVIDQKRDDQILRECESIIKKALKAVKLPVLREACIRSLREFSRRQLSVLRRQMQDKLYIYLAMLLATGKIKKPIKNEQGIPVISTPKQAREFVEAQTKASEMLTETRGYDTAPLYGVPAQISPKDLAKKVKQVIDRMASETALDPDDVSGRNSLRNRAEMEVRYAMNTQRLDELRAKGVKVVYIPPHADCSERCQPWQDRCYSLDRSYGKTDDNRAFSPVEEATDVYYTTKAGKTYKNGLFGFNCRHYAIPWELGMRYPKVSPKEEEREREITERQRELERIIRKWKIVELEAKASKNKKEEEYAHKKTDDWTFKYIQFCKTNGRAFIPNRIDIL